MIKIFQCEDTLTGILSGVYEAWDSHLGHENVRLDIYNNETLELFCEYEQVEPDLEKAEKVGRTIQRKMGEEAWEMTARAAACPDRRKADAIYRMIVLGLHLPDGKRVTGMLTNPHVRLLFELDRKVWHIAHRYMGFVRFRELENGVLFSEIHAEADVLPLIAPHFADRFPEENWMIHDRGRRKTAVHPSRQAWFLLEEVDEESLARLQASEEEVLFSRLWRGFHRAVGIDSRLNKKAQMSFLPLKFRSFMNEFD